METGLRRPCPMLQRQPGSRAPLHFGRAADHASDRSPSGGSLSNRREPARQVDRFSISDLLHTARSRPASSLAERPAGRGLPGRECLSGKRSNRIRQSQRLLFQDGFVSRCYGGAHDHLHRRVQENGIAGRQHDTSAITPPGCDPRPAAPESIGRLWRARGRFQEVDLAPKGTAQLSLQPVQIAAP